MATVSALRHQQQSTQGHSPARLQASGLESEGAAGHGGHGSVAGGHGGHDAPSWSRFTSASVLLSCTALYAVIAGMCSSIFSSSFHLRYVLCSSSTEN